MKWHFYFIFQNTNLKLIHSFLNVFQTHLLCQIGWDNCHESGQRMHGSLWDQGDHPVANVLGIMGVSPNARTTAHNAVHITPGQHQTVVALDDVAQEGPKIVLTHVARGPTVTCQPAKQLLTNLTVYVVELCQTGCLIPRALVVNLKSEIVIDIVGVGKNKPDETCQ